jgi:hypothetical protein
MNKNTTLATTSNLPYQSKFGRWIKADTRSLTFDPNIPEDVFKEFLERLLEAQTTLQFWIGDAINFAGAYKRGKYLNWLKKTPYKYSTLANFASCAGKFLPESRRSELSFTYHLHAGRIRNKRERDRLLAKAIKEKLTIKKLLVEIEIIQPRDPNPEPVFGPSINFKWLNLHHEPLNEQGVVLVFGMLCERLGFRVKGVRSLFPDCAAERRVKGKMQEVKIEFEYKSQNFALHKHNKNDCNLIVCWENDWVDCPIEVLCLKDEIEKMAHRR